LRASAGQAGAPARGANRLPCSRVGVVGGGSEGSGCLQGTTSDRGQNPVAGRVDDVALVAPSLGAAAPWPRRAGRGWRSRCMASIQPAHGGQVGKGADGARVTRAG
jgi:hypothetical protein